MKDVELLGIAKSADNNQIHHVATDPKASFTIVRPNLPEDYSPACVEWVDPRKVDYNLLPPTHLENTGNRLQNIYTCTLKNYIY